eukprot:Skav229098  [mRNA]  locus=scaffold92:308399:309949:- [translate_table: standard]
MDVRLPFQTAIQQMYDYGSCFPEQLAITVHPETQFCETAHYQLPLPVIPAALQTLYQSRVQAGQLLRFYTDGSCQDSCSPSSRYAAFACVVDLCATDDERFEQIQRWKATGVVPSTFQVVISSRVQGDQNINRAETQAVLAAASLGTSVELCVDSQYAIGLLHLATTDSVPRSCQDANLDLRVALTQVPVPPSQIHKIQAHRDPSTLSSWIDQYHAFGNCFADTAAKKACQDLNPALAEVLVRRQLDLATQRKIFENILAMTVQIQHARAAAVKTKLRCEDADLSTPTEGPSLHTRLSQWTPQETVTYPIPADPMCVADSFAWGADFLVPFFDWFKRCVWPAAPGGPTGKEIGVSWLELGISFSIDIASLLPILREESTGDWRVIFVKDERDMHTHHVTCSDFALAMERMWTQLASIFPDTFEQLGRGVNVSLFSQGYMNHTTGLSKRPQFPHQSLVADVVQQHLVNKKSYNCVIAAPWCDHRESPLVNDDWSVRCKRFKAARRISRRQGVSRSYV